MIDTKIILTLAGLLGALCLIDGAKDDKKEHFGMLPSFDLKVEREVQAPGGKPTGILNNYRSMLNPSVPFYTVPGTFQSELAPRFFTGDYGANISYNLPSVKNLASNPLRPIQSAETYGRGASFEGYAGASGCAVNGAGGPPYAAPPVMAPNYSNGNYNQLVKSQVDAPINNRAKSILPVGGMDTLNALGQNDQPIVWDRYMYANRNSRLRGLGDPIRGDLPIAPINNGWFSVAVSPNVDLQQGAMAVLAGNSEEGNKLADFIYATSGRSNTTIGGADQAARLANSTLGRLNTGAQYGTNVSAGGDVNVRAFP